MSDSLSKPVLKVEAILSIFSFSVASLTKPASSKYGLIKSRFERAKLLGGMI